ncbi:MAG TPA: hypothetical protein VJP02_16520 [Candidatus Sulfotelmatobacter sp.]|nr:hypothetical protein [Candidatus Sulfotelmatobacter sp.]
MRTLEQAKYLASRQLKEHLEGNMPILQSIAFNRFAQGLRVEDFEEVVSELIAQKVVERDLTKRGAYVIRKCVGVGHGTNNSNH